MRLVHTIAIPILFLTTPAFADLYPPTNITQPTALSFACEDGDAVQVIGTSGALAAGDVITGSDVRDIEISNGIVLVTYEQLDQWGHNPPDRELGGHMVYGWTGSAYEAALDDDRGDWTFFASGFASRAAEAHVLVATDDVVEVVWIFHDHRLDDAGSQSAAGYVPAWCGSPPCTCYHFGCGLVESASDGSAIPKPSNTADPWHRIRAVEFHKTVRIERCSPGYFVGYHSDPSLLPKNGLAANNSSSYGEREFGTGEGNAVTWSSAGVTATHPGPAEHRFLGIDDPNISYPNQHGGFPAEQSSGPFWAASIAYYNDALPFVRWVETPHRLEIGAWAFYAGDLGKTIVHYANSKTEADGRMTRFQMFLGVAPYESPNLDTGCTISGLSGTWRCYPGEPTSTAQALVTDNLSVTWPQ